MNTDSIWEKWYPFSNGYTDAKFDKWLTTLNNEELQLLREECCVDGMCDNEDVRDRDAIDKILCERSIEKLLGGGNNV